jgi:hypothetical protein
LKHLLLTQSFTSKLIHYYSYKISREDARKKFIKEEIESMDNNEELLNEFERFLPLYNDLQHKGVQFKCRPPMKARQLSEESELAYFLNDDGQLDYGMHIAAINQKFIEWQNEFLNRISENLIPTHPLYFMKEGLSRRTTLNNATSSEIIELDRVGETVFDFILMYSRRDCYKDNTIDYQEYANSSMNYELIDTQLGKSILPNKKLFEDKQIFVVFKFEAYRSTGSSIIVDYFNKYPQEQLTRQMENDLREFKEREQAISDKVMFTLQQLIEFFMKQHLKKDLSINEAIEKVPKYFNLEKKITEFFEQHEEYKLHHLIEVYEYFEKLCENEIFQHLEPSVKEDLDDKTLGEYKNKIKNFRNFGIDKNLVREAIRKYISRMFGGKREELDFNPEEKVFFLLTRPELWPKNIRDEMEDTYQDLIWGLDMQFHLKFKNIVHFYNLLGEE